MTNGTVPSKQDVLQACTMAPLETVLNLLSSCPSLPPTKDMAATAAQHGNTSVLRHFLANGAPMEYNERRLLTAAIKGGSQSSLQVLLDEGMDINHYMSHFGSPLCLAVVQHAPNNIIAWFLENGADPNSRLWASNYQTIAMAAAHNSTDVMKMLITHGAQVDRSKALHMAAREGLLDNVRFLVEEAGANVNEPGDPEIKPIKGTPLVCAAERGHTNVVEYLLQKGAIAEKD